MGAIRIYTKSLKSKNVVITNDTGMELFRGVCRSYITFRCSNNTEYIHVFIEDEEEHIWKIACMFEKVHVGGTYEVIKPLNKNKIIKKNSMALGKSLEITFDYELKETLLSNREVIADSDDED